jgi:hypothetical protein
MKASTIDQLLSGGAVVTGGALAYNREPDEQLASALVAGGLGALIPHAPQIQKLLGKGFKHNAADNKFLADLEEQIKASASKSRNALSDAKQMGAGSILADRIKRGEKGKRADMRKAGKNLDASKRADYTDANTILATGATGLTGGALGAYFDPFGSE